MRRAALFITAYALILLAGLTTLAQGRAEFDAWREILGSPGALAFHAITLVLVLYHAWTWFKMMPKAQPFLRVRDWRIPDHAIVVTAAASAVAAWITVFLAVWWLGP